MSDIGRRMPGSKRTHEKWRRLWQHSYDEMKKMASWREEAAACDAVSSVNDGLKAKK